MAPDNEPPMLGPRMPEAAHTMLRRAPTTATENPPSRAPTAPSGYVTAIIMPLVTPITSRNANVADAVATRPPSPSPTAIAVVHAAEYRIVAFRSARRAATALAPANTIEAAANTRPIPPAVYPSASRRSGISSSMVIHISDTTSESNTLVTSRSSARAALSMSRNGGLGSGTRPPPPPPDDPPGPPATHTTTPPTH